MDVDADLRRLEQKIEDERGFNCRFYKASCLRRRLMSRMRARGTESLTDYARLLDRDAGEYDRLIDALTINVSMFFRDPAVWMSLDREVIPRLFDRTAEPVRIWSAGCAGGEEAYSIAILAHLWAEREGRIQDLERLEIVGTDIDEASIAAAWQGKYDEFAIREIPDEIRGVWFTEGPTFRIRDAAKTRASFVRADLTTSPPLHDQSLIVCRNVLIYLERDTQDRVLRSFHEALQPGGFLVLGRVEGLTGATRSLFRQVSGKERIYQRAEAR